MRNINPFGLRMQPDLRAKVEEAAAQNHRSLNAEIIARLEESFSPTRSIIAIDEYHRTSPPSLANALEMIEQLRSELLAIAASPKE